MGSSGTSVSVIGIYATIVLAIGRFVRLIFDKISMRVFFNFIITINARLFMKNYRILQILLNFVKVFITQEQKVI